MRSCSGSFNGRQGDEDRDSFLVLVVCFPQIDLQFQVECRFSCSRVPKKKEDLLVAGQELVDLGGQIKEFVVGCLSSRLGLRRDVDKVALLLFLQSSTLVLSQGRFDRGFVLDLVEE